MVSEMRFLKKCLVAVAALGMLCAVGAPSAFAQPAPPPCPAGEIETVPGSGVCIIDPLAIPKYVTPLVIPPVMKNTGMTNNYDIAVRQFQQQILPAGMAIFPATTVWSYGPTADPEPTGGVAPARQFPVQLPGLHDRDEFQRAGQRPVDERVETQLWHRRRLADPTCCPSTRPCTGPTRSWTECRGGGFGTDCATDEAGPYIGPVPIVTHVHGAHVDPHSDGYPEAWWLPAGVDTSSVCTEWKPFR